MVWARLRLAGGATVCFVNLHASAGLPEKATAELLAWVRILERMRLDVGDLKPGEAESLALTYSVLAKSVEDRELMARAMRPES